MEGDWSILPGVLVEANMSDICEASRSVHGYAGNGRIGIMNSKSTLV